VQHARERVGGIRDGMDEVGGGLRLPFRYNRTSCVPSHGIQNTLQGKADSLVAVMDDWEQLYTHATLLTLPNIATILLELCRVMTKFS